MMPIGALELFSRHSEIPSHFPLVGALLHQPDRRGVARHMRRHVQKANGIGEPPEGAIDIMHGSAVPFDHEVRAMRVPAPQVGGQAARHGMGGRRLFASVAFSGRR